MKNIILLLVFVPLFISIKIPYTDIEWEWNWNFDFDFVGLIENLKSKVPDFLKNLQEEVKNFIEATKEKKKKLIEDLDVVIKEKYEKIKQKAEKINEEFIDKTTTIAKYLSYQVCNFTDMESYDECRNNKKEVFSRLVDIVQEEFKCSQIVSYITENLLSDDIENNLKHILFLINTISSNPDAIAKGKAQAVYDAVNCLIEKVEEKWPDIIGKIADSEEYKFNLKQDVTNLLVQTSENLVGIIHFQELDGYIEKASEKYGLIPVEEAKEIHQQIFTVLKRLNEFGDNFYNLSATLALNVTVKPKEKEVDVNQVFVSDFKDKGIKITLQSYNLINKYGASSIQTVVFDSPLVSIRGKNQKEGGTANTFVGITLYDENGEEILVEDIDISELRPIIYYRKNLFKAMTTCLFYNENADMIENTGVETQTVTLEDGIEYLKCIPNHLTSFTVGTYESHSVGGSDSDSLSGGVIFLIVLLCLIVVGGIGYYIWRRTRKVDNSQFNQAFLPNRDGLATS